MAKNERLEIGDKSGVPLTVTAGTKSGDPVVVGTFVGLAQTDADATTNVATVKLRGVFNFSVKGINAGGNSAVVQGDAIYYTAGDTPKLSKKATGTFFGIAWEPVTSGATATIGVYVNS